MTAKGKINASKVQAGDRIIVKVRYDAEGHATVSESSTKTGEGVFVARVIGKDKVRGGERGYYQARYLIMTSAGSFEAAPIQTMWLAPEDPAGIKRAHVEAIQLDKVYEAYPLADETAAPQDLTLDSHAGKVDNMNNESTATQNHTGSTVVSLLEKVWARIREDHPELPEVVITTGSGEGVKWGHFRPESWKVRAEEGAAVSTGPGRRHELFLASEALAKGANQVLQTMLHEGAHTLSKVRDVKDTSRQGRWHNATFRKAAEEMGLEHKASAADKSHGFSFVTLTQATKDRYADLLAELDREIRLTGLLPVWLGGTGDEDERGGEKITGKPTKTEGGATSGNLKATCGCAEPLIIRISRKVLDLGVVKCDACDELFTAA